MAPPVLVPIHVDALVVAPGKPMAAPGTDSSAPFQDTELLEPGAHLHWALPDGLTRGRHEQPGDDFLRFPAVPDLWLVLRWNPPPEAVERKPVPVEGDDKDGPLVVITALSGRTYRAWVIDGHTLETVPLEKWAPPDPTLKRPMLTAVGELEQGALPRGAAQVQNKLFDAAYYPASRQRFGFHDALEDVGAGPVSYAVVGWYSRLAEDPLYAAGNDEARRKFVVERRWEVPWKCPASIPTPLKEDGPLEFRLGSATLMEVSDKEGGRAQPKGVYLKDLQTRQNTLARGLEGFDVMMGPVIFKEPLSCHPDRIFCHGAVVDVAWNGLGGGLQGKPEKPPAPEMLIASSLYEAAAEGFGQQGLQAILTALELNLSGELGTNASRQGLAHALHASGFVSHQGGTDERWYLERTEQANLPDAGRQLGFTSATPKNVQDIPQGVTGVVVRDATLRGQLAGLIAPGGDAATLKALRNRTVFTRAEVMLLTQVQALQGKLKAFRGAEPRPRYYKPTAPVTLLSGCGRAWRYGQDGRLDPNRLDPDSEGGFLQCRDGQGAIDALSIELAWISAAPNVTAADLIGFGPDLKSLPTTISSLVRESLLLDPTNARRMAEVWLNRAKVKGQDYQDALPEAEEAFLVECELWWGLADLDAGEDLADEIRSSSRYEGALPSPIALTPWRQPWAPLFAECAYELLPYATAGNKAGELNQSWSLEDPDWEARPDGKPAAGVAAQERALLSVAVADQLVSTAARRLKIDDQGQVYATVGPLTKMDVLSFALSALEPALAQAGMPARAGALRILELRLVDAFGQVRGLISNGLPIADTNLRRAAADQPLLLSLDAQRPPHALMRPRLPYWSRLNLRFVGTAGPDSAPICGFLLADLVEHGLEVFDAAGQGLGQLRHRPLEGGGTSLVWETHPWATVIQAGAGEDAPARVVGDPSLLGFLSGLLATAPAPSGESALAAMLRTLDTTWLTLDRRGGSTEALHRLVGRPIALVKASLALETVPAGLNPVSSNPAIRPQPAGLQVKLGSLTQVDDGLLGYYVGGDYSAFRPVDATVLGAALESGPFSGFQGETPGSGTRPIDHPYVSDQDQVAIEANKPLEVVMLLEPHGGIHAAGGFVPRKRISLPPEHLYGLEGLAPTFSVAPVLLEPEAPRLPVPVLADHGWEWVQTTGEGIVRTAVKPSDSTGAPGERAVVAVEGWLKLQAAE